MKSPEAFLSENGFTLAEDIDRSKLIARFAADMQAGLEGRPSSLAMLKAYVAPTRTNLAGKKAVVLDAGGTNLRGAVVSIPHTIERKENRPMPGVEREVGEEEFYGTFADEIRRLLPYANVEKVGWCFSYPAETTPELDARLLMWTKNIKAPAIVGQFVGEELKKRAGIKEIAVVNDTVATLLAAKAMEGEKTYSSYIGFIIGTGTNTAYVDKDLQMIINAESGAFDKVPQSVFDVAVDQKSGNPGKQRLEKMIAGAYLGPIGHEILKAAAKAGYFSSRAAGVIKGMGTISTKDLSDFCAGAIDFNLPPDDARLAKRFALPVFERAATLAAVELAAFVIQSGEGIQEDEPVAICIDGSTYYKTQAIDFPKAVKRELDEILVRRRNVHYEIVPQVEDAPMIGAAIAAMI
jgi:hexokinase